MNVPAQLRTRRLIAALLLLASLPVAIAILAANHEPSSEPAPGPHYNPVTLPGSSALDAITARELARSRRYAVAAKTMETPSLLGPESPDSLPTLVLPPRAEAYGLKELQQLVPAAFGSGDTAVFLRAGIVVATGSTLTINASESPEVRLASRPDGFASIVSRGGVLNLVGAEGKLLRITSWDDAAGAPDENPDDGRAFVLSQDGAMDMTWADLGYLGFGTGITSGVAWKGTPEVRNDVPPDSGTVTHSTMHHNWFGAYTFEARNMRWTDNMFANNHAYGFDPHDLSNGFQVENNTARGNGRHGFIFSRGCNDNLLRNNVSYDNRGHGFMIDDGRSVQAEHSSATALASNNNRLLGNWAYDNGGSGIEIEGGTGNVVQGNHLTHNRIGVRIKNNASAAVRRNVITDNWLLGVDVRNPDNVEVTGNRVHGGWGGIALGSATLSSVRDNKITGESVDFVVDGKTKRASSWESRLQNIYKRKPMLLVWTVVLLVPVLGAGSGVLVQALRGDKSHRVLS